MISIHWYCPSRSPEPSSVLEEEEVANVLHTGNRHFHHKVKGQGRDKGEDKNTEETTREDKEKSKEKSLLLN